MQSFMCLRCSNYLINDISIVEVFIQEVIYEVGFERQLVNGNVEMRKEFLKLMNIMSVGNKNGNIRYY